VRGISDGPNPYILLGALRDLGRSESDLAGILRAKELSHMPQKRGLCDLKSVRLSAVLLRLQASNA
jgi:hypothetical protein